MQFTDRLFSLAAKLQQQKNVIETEEARASAKSGGRALTCKVAGCGAGGG